MTDFDARVRDRLQRLDAAVPLAAPPSLARTTPEQPRRRRRRQIIVLVAATVALLGATTLLAIGTTPPPDPAQVARDQADEQRVRDDLATYTVDDPCMTKAEARALIRKRLDALGLADWTIRDDGHTKAAPCVTSAASGDTHEVLLLPSMGKNVATALDAMTAELMRQCLGANDAMGLLRATLTKQGISDPRIEIGDVRGIPLEYGNAYAQHAAAGCAVYGGAMWDDAGRYTWLIRDR